MGHLLDISQILQNVKKVTMSSHVSGQMQKIKLLQIWQILRRHFLKKENY